MTGGAGADRCSHYCRLRHAVPLCSPCCWSTPHSVPASRGRLLNARDVDRVSLRGGWISLVRAPKRAIAFCTAQPHIRRIAPMGWGRVALYAVGAGTGIVIVRVSWRILRLLTVHEEPYHCEWR